MAKNRKAYKHVLAAAALLPLCGLGCATPGEKFQLLPPPRDSRARVYVYRTSDSSIQYDYGEIISLDDNDLGTIRAPGLWGKPGCQYIFRSVPPGSHKIRARSKSLWFHLGTIPENPMEVAFVAEPGQSYFVRVRQVLLGSSLHGGTSVTMSTKGGISTTSTPMMMEVFWDKQILLLPEEDPPSDLTKCERVSPSEPPGGD